MAPTRVCELLFGTGPVLSSCDRSKRPKASCRGPKWSVWHMSTRTAELIPTRQSLLRKLKDLADDQSWREFFETYSDLIYAMARKKGLSAAEADEVVQETVIVVARKMVTFDYRTDGSFKAWLMKLANWRIIDQFRRRSRPEASLDIDQIPQM